MKFTPKHYATNLFNLVDGKKAEEVNVVLKSFVEVLAENNQIAKAKSIIEEFSKVWNREKGIIEAEIVSANELDEEMIEELKGYIAKESGRKKVEVITKIDKDILGGVVIKYEDQILDGSLKTKLVELKERMAK